MYDSIRYANGSITTCNDAEEKLETSPEPPYYRSQLPQQQQLNNNNSPLVQIGSPTTMPTTPSDEPQGAGDIICTHDGVLLKKASAEHINDINSSGSLSLVKYSQPRRRMCIEWKPNENILIADDSQDQGDWALVDTIKQRTRTISECSAFNMKPTEAGVGLGTQPRILRVNLDDVSALEVKHRGQEVRFIRKTDMGVHSEFFFQHGNADLFVRSMQYSHIIDCGQPLGGNSEQYAVLKGDDQKWSKTFAELDIGQIKSIRIDRDNWWANKVFGFIGNKIPDHKLLNRPNTLSHGGGGARYNGSSNFSDNYQVVGLSSSGDSQTSSLDKSPAADGSILMENLKEKDQKIINTLPEREVVTRGSPLNESQWLEFFTAEGRVSDPTRICEVIFHGGIQDNLRSEVWKYLLNYYQWFDTASERVQRRELKSREYYSMKAQWLSMTPKQEINFLGYRERKCQIEKDVKRTDRSLNFFAGENNANLETLHGILMTYVMYNFDLGYVQGMSDLLAPILAIQGNEVDAFWCFVGFMDRVFANFDIDQAGMKTQFGQLRRLLEFANPRLFNYLQSHDSDNMYFCFRWLLVWYKRELSNDDNLLLWECLWTRQPCQNFHLFISLALLDHESDVIIESQFEFTEILKHVNELSGNIDLIRTLQTAEAIYLQIMATGENLPNDIRSIIGEPLLPDTLTDADGRGSTPASDSEHDFDDPFYQLVPELTPEEQRRQQELLEEACERSMYFQFM